MCIPGIGRRALLVLFTAILLRSSTLAQSGVPAQLRYQGRLTNATGTP